MGSSEYRNTANKIEQTLHHPKEYYQHTHTVILFLDLLGVSGFWKKKNSKPLLLHFKYNFKKYGKSKGSSILHYKHVNLRESQTVFNFWHAVEYSNY